MPAPYCELASDGGRLAALGSLAEVLLCVGEQFEPTETCSMIAVALDGHAISAVERAVPGNGRSMGEAKVTSRCGKSSGVWGFGSTVTQGLGRAGGITMGTLLNDSVRQVCEAVRHLWVAPCRLVRQA